MQLNSVSFQGRLAQTKKGNTYEKTNTCKRIGTGVGLVGSGILAATPIGQLFAAGTAAKYAKSLGALTAGAMGITGAFILASTLLLRGLGTIPDSIINKSRKAKADNTAQQATVKTEELAKV